MLPTFSSFSPKPLATMKPKDVTTVSKNVPCALANPASIDKWTTSAGRGVSLGVGVDEGV
jgi:hypothetical protein